MQVDRNYEVVVVGGGIAGVAAVLECARSGVRTALIEKTILWGGLATSGLVPIYMPLCDGKGRQVTFGIAEELLKASIKYGPGGVPEKWAHRTSVTGPPPSELYPEGDLGGRYMTYFAPMSLVLGLDEVLADCGADLWLDTLACVPIMDGNAVAGVEVENKSGRIRVGARCVIDATGDADVVARAGAPCRENLHYPSLLYQFTSLDQARKAVDQGSARKLVTWHGGGSANEFDVGYDGPLGKLSGVKGEDVSAFVMESRRVMREKLAGEQAALGEEGREDCYPAALPTQAQFRMTRTIVGREIVNEAPGERRETSIGLISDCRKAGAVWEVPYGALVPREAENLLAAGRCVAAEGYSWQVTRLIQAAALTGQVAGIAAALALKAKTSPHEVAASDVQRAAEAKGIALHL